MPAGGVAAAEEGSIMIDWSRLFTAAQARNAIRALLDPLNATGTDVYLGWTASGEPTWQHLASATQVATATDVSGNLGFAKAWALFGTASATGLLSGYPSTLTVSRISAGNYTIDFGAKLFAASQYAFFCNAEQDVGTLLIYAGKNATGVNGQLASSFDMICVNSAGAVADPNFMTAMFFGATA